MDALATLCSMTRSDRCISLRLNLGIACLNLVTLLPTTRCSRGIR